MPGIDAVWGLVPPWALTGCVVVASVAAVVARPVGVWCGRSRVFGCAFALSVLVVVAFTWTPAAARADVGRGCMPLDVAGFVAGLQGVSDVSLNALLCVPAGVLVVWVLPWRRALAVAVVLCVAPAGVELVQLVVPDLNRTCQVSDVVANCVGVLVGTACGAGVRWVAVRVRPST